MKQFFTTNEAAKYLSLSVPTIKYHRYTSRMLSGRMFGNSWMYTRKELDEFKANKRPAGRPKKLSA